MEAKILRPSVHILVTCRISCNVLKESILESFVILVKDVMCPTEVKETNILP